MISGSVDEAFVGDFGGGGGGISSFSALTLSSHFPLTESTLLPTRWEGVHLLVAAVGVVPLVDPVELLDNELFRVKELVLARPVREEVLSKRRV